MRPALLALLATACGSSSTPAARPEPPPIPTSMDTVVIGERLALHSSILREDRVLNVYRPPPDEANTPYLVVYLLDGDAHFHHTTGLIHFLMSQARIPRVMVVGLANIDRDRDFTPTHVADRPTSGGADKFLAFLERELIPSIEGRYPTARYRILIGHSLGGMLAIHAMNQKPDLFDAYISISPTLAWGDGLMQRQTEALLTARPTLDKALYLTVGNEPADMTGSNRAYAAMLRGRAPAGLRWQFEEMKGEDHGSIVHRAIYRGLELVFQGWAPPATVDSLAGLEAHYQTLSTRFRIPVKVPEALLNLFAYQLLAAGKVPDAIAAFRRNADLYPGSANVHDSLGEALERAGQLDAAIESYERAVKLAAINRDPLLPALQERLDRARAKKK